MQLGQEGNLVLVVDNVLEEPARLVSWASRQTFRPAGSDVGGYPGVRVMAPPEYYRSIVKGLHPLIMKAYELNGLELASAGCSLSLTTQPAQSLSVRQRIPHIDTTSPHQFAILHYLCDERFGGTSFFRHQATQFESITETRIDTYDSACMEELERVEPPQTYVDEACPHFELTGQCEARYNRLVIYRSNVLHSPRIKPGAALRDDPATGRLTANIFLNYRPALAA